MMRERIVKFKMIAGFGEICWNASNFIRTSGIRKDFCGKGQENRPCFGHASYDLLAKLAKDASTPRKMKK